MAGFLCVVSQREFDSFHFYCYDSKLFNVPSFYIDYLKEYFLNFWKGHWYKVHLKSDSHLLVLIQMPTIFFINTVMYMYYFTGFFFRASNSSFSVCDIHKNGYNLVCNISQHFYDSLCENSFLLKNSCENASFTRFFSTKTDENGNQFSFLYFNSLVNLKTKKTEPKNNMF